MTRPKIKGFNKKWSKKGVTFSTLNVRSLGCKRADADFYYSYCESLGHDATCLTETWNSQRNFESWNCVTSEENNSGKDRAAGVCLLLSNRFASLQLSRGNIGTRGCWVRIQGPVCNLLIIGVYLPPQYSKTCAIGIMQGLKRVLNARSPHDCVILLGDFNVRLPRRFRDIVGPYAHAQLKATLSAKKKSILHLMATNDLFAVNTCFRPRRRQSFHTWRRKHDGQKGQIDYIMATKRWRSCFTDSKVSWSPAKFKHGKPTDHGMVTAKFKWRVRERKARHIINWRAIRPEMTLGDNPRNVNRLLDEYNAKCEELTEDTTLLQTRVATDVTTGNASVRGLTGGTIGATGATDVMTGNASVRGLTGMTIGAEVTSVTTSNASGRGLTGVVTGATQSCEDAMETLNRVSVEAASQVIPPKKSVRAERMRPSLGSIEFAALRALEIGEGVTPQRERELHRKMHRMRRRDYQQWHVQEVTRLNECVSQHRWTEARAVERTLLGVSRQARKMPAKGYKQDVTVCSDASSALHWSRYMQDLFARRLVDRVHHGIDWPEVEGALDGPGAAWSDELFDWAVNRVHVGRAPGHNGIQVELYKYSKWARDRLRTQLKHIWETAQFPEKMVTGVATPCHKSGDTDDYSRYRIIVVFPAEYKIFATMLLKRIISECAHFLRD